MNPTDNPNHAALIVQAGLSLNSLDSAVRGLGQFKTPDKKLQANWAELRRLASITHTRLLGRLDGPTGDFINEVTNQAEQVLRCLCYLPADQRRKLVAQAETMARPFQLVEEAVTE